MSTIIKGFTNGKWNGDPRYFKSFKDRVTNSLEAKGLTFLLDSNPAYDIARPNPITEVYMRHMKDSDIMLSAIRSLLGAIPLSSVQDLLDDMHLTSRRKAIRIMNRLTRSNDRLVLTAIAEIEHDLTQLKPVHNHEDAQHLVVEIVEAQRLLSSMNQPMTDMKMKLLLLQHMHDTIFDSVTNDISKHTRWSFARARDELEDAARHYRLRNSKQQRSEDDSPVKKFKQEDQINSFSPSKFVAAAATAAVAVPTSTHSFQYSPSNLECYNCKNKGHIAKDCQSPFCARCGTTWPSINHPQRHSRDACPQQTTNSSRGRGGRTISFQRGGRSIRGGRDAHNSFTQKARVNSIASENQHSEQWDDWNEDKEQQEEEQITRDINQWQAAKDYYENQFSVSYDASGSISMMSQSIATTDMHPNEQALLVLSDSGANISACPSLLPNLLGLQQIAFEKPFLVEFGNKTKEWSYHYLDFPALFGSKIAILSSLRHIILSNTVANQNGYTIAHTFNMTCVISQKGEQGNSERKIFESSVNQTSNLYLFNVKDVLAVLPDSPIEQTLPPMQQQSAFTENDSFNENNSNAHTTNHGVHTTAINGIKKTRLTTDIVNQVIDLHKRMDHASQDTMANAIATGAWLNTGVTSQNVIDAFSHGDCLSCKLAKTRKLSIPQGSGAKPPYIGHEISVDYIAVTITARGGYTGFFLFKDVLTGLLVPYLVKSKASDVFYNTCMHIRAYLKSFGKDVRLLRVDAGTVEADKDTVEALNLHQIRVLPALPEAQYQNPVERSVQTVAISVASVLSNQENLNNTFWGLALLSFCDTWNHTPNSLTRDVSPMFYLTNTPTDVSVQFRFSFGQAVVVAKLKAEKDKQTFKFITNNDFGYAVGSSQTGNHGTLIYFPKRQSNRVYMRNNVTPINLGNELLFQSDNSAPANVILTERNEIILPENSRLKAPGVRFLDVSNEITNSDANNSQVIFDDNSIELPPCFVTTCFEDNDDFESLTPPAPDTDNAPIASRINARKRTPSDIYPVQDYIQTLQVNNLSEPESDDEPTLGQIMDSKHWKGPHGWKEAIDIEFQNLETMGTGEIVQFNDIPSDAPLYPTKLVCKKKREPSTGKVTQRKIRLCALGNTGRNNPKHASTTDTIKKYFAPTGHEKSLKIFFLLAVILGMFLSGLDVKSAFLYPELKEPTFIMLPTKLTFGKKVYWKLKKTLYGLPQSPQAFYEDIAEHLLSNGYQRTEADPCLFYLRTNPLELTMCFVHVDDFAIAATSQQLLDSFILLMSAKYNVKPQTKLEGFLGMKIDYLQDGSVTFSQPTKIQEVVEHCGLENFAGKFPTIPMASTFSDDFQNDAELIDCIQYMCLLGKLLFIIKTRPDTAYAVNRLATRSVQPTEKDWQALVRVVLYLKGTIHLGIKFNRQSVAEATAATRLYCYVDAAFSCHSDSKSHTGYCFSLGDLGGMFYSKSFKQDNTTLSSTESENAAAVEAAKEIIWFRSLLNELGFSQLEPTIVFADNSSMITLAQDFSGNHKRVKHYLRRINFLIELIKTNVIHFTHVATEKNIADILTKPLGPQQFIQLRGILLGYDRI